VGSQAVSARATTASGPAGCCRGSANNGRTAPWPLGVRAPTRRTKDVVRGTTRNAKRETPNGR